MTSKGMGVEPTPGKLTLDIAVTDPEDGVDVSLRESCIAVANDLDVLLRHARSMPSKRRRIGLELGHASS